VYDVNKVIIRWVFPTTFWCLLSDGVFASRIIGTEPLQHVLCGHVIDDGLSGGKGQYGRVIL
jgi:hypothetical protein